MRTYHLAETTDKPPGRVRLVKMMEPSHAAYDVTLWRRNKSTFAVQYGKQVDDELSYASAADMLGHAIMHALACEGLLD